MEQKLFFNKKLTNLTSDPSSSNNLFNTLNFHDWTSTGGSIINYNSFSSEFTNKFQNYGFSFYDTSKLKANKKYRLEIEGTSIYGNGDPAAFNIYNKNADINITASIVFDSTLFIGTADGRVYASTNGVDWILRKKVNSKITAFGYSLNYIFFGTESCEIYRWLKTDINLLNWGNPINIFGDWSRKKITCISTTNNAEVYVGVYGDVGVYRSLDNGNTWGGFKNDRGIIYYDENLPQEWYVTSLLYIDDSEIYVGIDNWSQEYTSKYSIFKYTLYGSPPFQFKYWKSIGGSNTIDKKVKTLAKNKNTGSLFFGTYGTSYNTGGVFRSEDSGTSWTQLNISNRNINLIIEENDILFVGTQSSMYSSDDDGDNWSTTIVQSEFPEIQTVSIFEDNIFIGTNKNLFFSIDGGELWAKNRLKGIQITNSIGINEVISTSPFDKTIIFTTGNDNESQKLYLENSSLSRFSDPITTTITKLELYNYESTNNFIKFIGLSNIENEGFLLPKKEMLLDINIVNNYFNTNDPNNLYSNPIDFSLIISKIKNTENLYITDTINNYIVYIGQLNENEIFFPAPGENTLYKRKYMISLKNFLLPQEIDINTDYYLHLLLNVEKQNETVDCNINITGIGYQS